MWNFMVGVRNGSPDPPPHTHTHFLNKVMFLKSYPGKLLKAERLMDIFVLTDEDKIIQVTEGVAPR